MIFKQQNEAGLFQFQILNRFPEVVHGVFTRNGGCSKDPYTGLNVGYGVGDDKNAVRRNREMIAQCMNGHDLVFTNQVHGINIRVLSNNSGLEPEHPADALITPLSGKNLVIQTADCQALLIYDPLLRVIANVHSGWRGSVNNIIGNTISVMGTSFDCKPENMVVGIGPSLGPCCSEFINYESEIPEKYWKYMDDSRHFNFWAISVDQLIETGIQPGNIMLSQICTRCNSNTFFSYRKNRITGRFATVIGLL